jgi:hypothetical protein
VRRTAREREREKRKMKSNEKNETAHERKCKGL